MWVKRLCAGLLGILPVLSMAQPSTAPATAPAEEGSALPTTRQAAPRANRTIFGAASRSRRPTTGPTSRPARQVRTIPRGPVTSIDDQSITLLVRERRDQEPVERTFPLNIHTQVTRQPMPDFTAGAGPGRRTVQVDATGGSTLADVKVGQQVMIMTDDAGALRLIVILEPPPTTRPTQE